MAVRSLNPKQLPTSATERAEVGDIPILTREQQLAFKTLEYDSLKNQKSDYDKTVNEKLTALHSEIIQIAEEIKSNQGNLFTPVTYPEAGEQ